MIELSHQKAEVVDILDPAMVRMDKQLEPTKICSAPDELPEGWNVDFSCDKEAPWSDLTTAEKSRVLLLNLCKIVAIVGCLYLFICSLSFLADGFRLLGGKRAGHVFRDSEVFNNGVAGLMVGVLATVLVQSSSTSTSIVVTMVAAELLTVKQAIPIVMGANIGTSVTSTIVALGHISDRDEFRRAFACATIHDCFNYLSVAILLPLEIATGYLFHLTEAIIDGYGTFSNNEKPPDMLKVLTNPLTKGVIQLDKKIMTKIAQEKNATKLAELEAKSMLKGGKTYLFDSWSGSDTLLGLIVLLGALTILCICLYVIIRLLKSILRGRIAVWLHASINGDIVSPIRVRISDEPNAVYRTFSMAWVSNYVAMGVGMGLTILVQSSSITTSALTPLVGVGVVKLERVFPLVLGANIGTTVTSVLAALAADSTKIAFTLQVAYAHLFFNLTGIFIWFVIPPMRKVPIKMSRVLGDCVADYRWFALTYLFVMFLVVPGVFVAFSYAGLGLMMGVLVIPAVLVSFFILTVSWMQKNRPNSLPGSMRTWEFVPKFLRSLEPWDKHVFGCLFRKCSKSEAERHRSSSTASAQQASAGTGYDV